MTAFYLNFLYRAYGYNDLALGALVGAQAAGAVLGAVPAARLPRVLSRRGALLIGGTFTAAGIVGILAFAAFVPLLLASALLGMGGLVVYSSGSALLADATTSDERSTRFGQQFALSTLAAFVASVIAGGIAAPVALALGTAQSDVWTLQALVAIGGLVALASALPILFVTRAPVPRVTQDAPQRTALVRRFLTIEAIFGFGAGSFVPFINLFFADRYGVPFATLGAILGAIGVAGSVGAILHARSLAPRLGPVRAVVLVQLLSLPFALLAAFTGNVAIAVGALGARAALMYGSAPTWSSFVLSSFTPAERAGVQATLFITWNASAAVGSFSSGAVRSLLGDQGWTANLLTLVAVYLCAALLELRLFRRHVPRGDALAAATADLRV